MPTHTGCLETRPSANPPVRLENQTCNVLVLLWMLPLEYMQIRVYDNRHSDARNLYSCRCECSLTVCDCDCDCVAFSCRETEGGDGRYRVSDFCYSRPTEAGVSADVKLLMDNLCNVMQKKFGNTPKLKLNQRWCIRWLNIHLYFAKQRKQ